MNSESKTSTLAGALRRIGGQLSDVDDVVGMFVPDPCNGVRGRLRGVLIANDAKVRVSFDVTRVELPRNDKCHMSVSGKLWLDETRSTFILMVKRYRYLPATHAVESQLAS